MKAALLNQERSSSEVRSSVRTIQRRTEVPLRTVGAGLCHSDPHLMERRLPLKVPAMPGHESAGVVEAVGEA